MIAKNRFATLWACLALLAIFPIWMVPRMPLLDFPNHLARAFILAHLHDPHYQFDQSFRADWGLYPYVGMDLILVWLQRFVSIEVAGRIFASLCVVSLPFSVLWFLRWVNPGHDRMAFFSLFVSYEMFFLQGFLNFHLSLAASFFVVGLWFWFSTKNTALRWFALLLAATALYFVHLIGFALTGFILFFYLLFSRSHLKSFIQLILLYLPGGVLFLLSRPGLDARHDMQFRAMTDKIYSAIVVPVHGFSIGFDNVALLLVLLAIFVACWRNPEIKWNGPWRFVCAAMFVTYWLLPLSWGETFDIDIRVLPVVLLLLLATARIGRRQKYLMSIALLLFVCRLVDVTVAFRADQPLLASMTKSFSLIAPNSKVLPLVESGKDEEEDQLFRPYAHYWAYAMIERGAFSPYLFDIKGQTPLRMTADPYAPDGFWELEYDEVPEWTDIQDTYDYVWAYNVSRFNPGLDSIGSVIYEQGLLRLYQIRKIKAAAPKSHKRRRPQVAVH